MRLGKSISVVCIIAVISLIIQTLVYTLLETRGLKGIYLLTAIIDASWKVNAYYNGVCMRRGACYVCVIHFLCPWTVSITSFAFLS